MKKHAFNSDRVPLNKIYNHGDCLYPTLGHFFISAGRRKADSCFCQVMSTAVIHLKMWKQLQQYMVLLIFLKPSIRIIVLLYPIRETCFPVSLY